MSIAYGRRLQTIDSKMRQNCCFQTLRQNLENVERERQKLSRDLASTNQRVAAFAQDVDDQNARTEEANREKLR